MKPLDARRNEGCHAESVMALSGQRIADGAEPRTARLRRIRESSMIPCAFPPVSR